MLDHFIWLMLNILHIFLLNNLIVDFESMLIVHFVSVESILMFCSTEIYRFYFN